ncbi:MAG TPA: carbohydrate porin [Candidatus Binataceae bacterium]|nr:carbohydrate porin [Candidatus Binataceae bacterium]
MRRALQSPGIIRAFAIVCAIVMGDAWAPALCAQQSDPWTATAGDPFLLDAAAVTPWWLWNFKPPSLTAPATGSTGNSDPAAPEIQPSIEQAAEGQTQTWNLHAQNTDIMQGYPAISAKYSGVNSLPPGGQIRETVSLDFYGGVRLWPGAEAHLDLLMWQGFGLHDTLGVDDFPNGEAYKVGTGYPRVNIARLFIRQTIGFGGEQEDAPDDELTLAGKQDISRLTLTIGRLTPTDIFDKNTYAGDPRTQFMNWSLMANGAWDYPSDSLGYTTGLAIELNQPKWTLRYGFFQMPRLKNNWTAEDAYFIWPGFSGAGDGEFFHAWGMVAEFERRYSIDAHPGAVRFLAYLNQERMGSYHAALSIPGADISQTRAYRYKYGFGLNAEQEITQDAGVFSRLGWNDGHEEAWMFTDINYTASLGISIKGQRWQRPDDVVGLAGVLSGISRVNQRFLNAGGTDILDGDGALSYGPEEVLEIYYDCDIWKGIHFGADYQFVANPAFNRDRGPVSVLATRLHVEF